ncbi:iron chaperone [Nocardioides acrostichi]|uniref:DUF1801 domain-containing protein n=1 Tax=Nocardioides acrostichi TaxID=2784339 RepID=A0A930YCL0_9ACTN|nr:DUF1801 domain-containing protein [Nocardioides acrostichi]MBF4163613.1 DUF1801 domain-containing protein [Nocardioides acrostichi]
MPSPKRASLDDYYAQLSDAARPHLERLRELSLAAAPDLTEKLAWNNPAFHRDDVRLWMLQAFKAHCSLRFPTHQFADQRAAVEAAGYEAGEGFVKLPYDRPLPEDLLVALIGARLAEFERTGSTWSG